MHTAAFLLLLPNQYCHSRGNDRNTGGIVGALLAEDPPGLHLKKWDTRGQGKDGSGTALGFGKGKCVLFSLSPGHLKTAHTSLQVKFRCCRESQEAWRAHSWLQRAGQMPCLSFYNNGFKVQLISGLRPWELNIS